MRLVQAHPDWLLGFVDETWWSRFAQPNLSSWCEEGQPLRLVEQKKCKEDPDPQALARWMAEAAPPQERVWLRFVDGRPVSAVTTQFLEWCCEQLETLGIRAWILIWDNATWHTSKALRTWIRQHNRR